MAQQPVQAPGKVITVKEAYNKGWRSKASEDFEKAQERFILRYCNHGYYSSCDICIAWHNGYDDQGQHVSRHHHALRCPLGLADRNNHNECDWGN